MKYMTQSDWDAFSETIDGFHEDAFQQDITWQSVRTKTSIHGEENNLRSVDIPLKGLMLYNYYRSWPMNKPTRTGEIDQESAVLYLNNKYLQDLGYINSQGQFNFNPVLDRFIVRGLTYKTSGDTQTAQAGDKPLFHFIILKREDLPSQQSKY